MPNTLSDTPLAARPPQQQQREVDEAVRVSMMSSEERRQWLMATWDKLQSIPLPIDKLKTQRPAARCWQTLEEKNRAERDEEISAAIQIQCMFSSGEKG